MLAASPERVLQRLDFTVVRRLDGLLQGDYRTLFRGSGLDLAELREYQVTDDVRYIDWNVTARMQTPYVRQYNEDRELTSWFLLDLSPSMDFGTVKMLKRNLLVDFASVLARLLTRRGNRVGAILFGGNSQRIVPPGSGRGQVLLLINELLAQPYLEKAPATDLSVLLQSAMSAIRRRSLMFIVSDFASRPGWERSLGALSQRHEVLAVRVHDPRETELPDVGVAVFQDAETGLQLYVDTHDRGFRRRLTEAARRREYELKAVLGRAGVDLLSLSTDGDLVKDLIGFMRLRKQRKLTPASFARPNAALAGVGRG